jgi:hypothetical protein
VILAVPATIPVTTPVIELTSAISGEPLIHVPPGKPLFRAVVAPTQTSSVPKMSVGLGLTVNTIVLLQPVDVNVYAIVVVPGRIPVTTPVTGSIVALEVRELLHVPPPEGLVSVTV